MYFLLHFHKGDILFGKVILWQKDKKKKYRSFFINSVTKTWKSTIKTCERESYNIKQLERRFRGRFAMAN